MSAQQRPIAGAHVRPMSYQQQARTWADTHPGWMWSLKKCWAIMFWYVRRTIVATIQSAEATAQFVLKTGRRALALKQFLAPTPTNGVDPRADRTKQYPPHR